MKSTGSTPVDVAVIGAGPAGVAVAVGLARLGHAVALISDRRRAALEGGSPRVLQALQAAGLTQALASVRVRADRIGDWGGRREFRGHEFLIDRTLFDAALHRDAQAAGVRWLRGHVDRCTAQGDGWRVAAGDVSVNARALVDARGRRLRAPAQRGPRLLAVVRRFEVSAGAPATGIAAGDAAWYWFADDGAGRLDVQAVTRPQGLKSRADLMARLFDAAALPSLIAERLAHARGEAREGAGEGPTDGLRACAAGAWCREPADQAGRLLVGDAALAVDPLSGHGIYEALAAAPANVAAVNTWLQGGDWALVRTFMRERAQEIWSRKVAASHGFYRESGQVSTFWEQTAQDYAALASGEAMLHDAVASIQQRPVLNGARIESRRVLVAPRWPRGVWRFGEIDLAELMDCCGPEGRSLETAAQRLQQPRAQVQRALQWLRDQGALPAGGEINFRRTETVGAQLARSST